MQEHDPIDPTRGLNPNVPIATTPPTTPPQPPAPPENDGDGLRGKLRKVGRSLAGTVDFGIFAKIGGKVSVAMGEEGLGVCFLSGFGVGFQGEVSTATRMPSTGLVVSSRMGGGTSITGSLALESSVTGDPLASDYVMPGGNSEVQLGMPGFSGQQFSLDLVSGAMRESHSLSAELQAHVAAGVCLAVEF